MSSSKIRKLAKLFERLGTDDPEGWARSQVKEGIPQFARFVFLKAAWEEVVGPGSDQWIEGRISDWRQTPDAPYAGAGRALHRLLKLGANKHDLTDLVRAMQAELLFSICSLLDGASVPTFLDETMPEVNWMLMHVPEDGGDDPQQVGGLHESVLETDPLGREARPLPE